MSDSRSILSEFPVLKCPYKAKTIFLFIGSFFTLGENIIYHRSQYTYLEE